VIGDDNGPVLEVERFLADHPPFAGMDPERLARVASLIEVEYFPPGAMILEQGGPPSRFAYVVRRGSVDLVDGERTVDRLDEGELFGFPSLLSRLPPLYGVRAQEETICYLLAAEQAREVFGDAAGLRFLTLVLRDRVVPAPTVPVVTVGDVAHAPLVRVSPATPAIETARLMTAAGVSAAVVESPAGPGIVTDRDLRVKVVAGGLDPGGAVGDIATTPARTIDPEAAVDAALITMLELGIHHLPVVASGTVIGMLTDLDLLGQQRRDAFRLRSEIERASRVEDVAAAGRRIPEVVVPLVRAGVDAEHVGSVLAALADALVSRLLDLAADEIGPAPGAYAWLALGSAGRREQGFVTDQDHALVYATGLDDGWFAAAAASVVAGLEAAGIPRCESKVMASEVGWRGDTGWWEERLSAWMDLPEEKAAFVTALVFDARVVTGTLDAGPLMAAAVGRASANHHFLRRLTRLALDSRVPIGFLGNLVVGDDGEEGTIDIKQGGTRPVTEMARVFALRAGVGAVSTVARLRQAAAAGVVDVDTAEGLAEAFVLFADLRLRHQAFQLRAGEPLDNLIRLDRLGRIERGTVRNAFRVVRAVRRELADELLPRPLGR
jgi:CBS domain-containing protein